MQLKFLSPLAFFVALFVSFVAHGQTTQSFEDDKAKIDQFERQLELYTRQFDRYKTNDGELIELQTDVNALNTAIADLQTQFNATISDSRALLAELGDPPADDQAPENQTITIERDRNNETIALLSVYNDRLNDIGNNASLLGREIRTIRRDLFQDALLKRVDIQDYSIATIARQFSNEFATFAGELHRWWTRIITFKLQNVIVVLSLSLVLGLMIFGAMRHIFGQFAYVYMPNSAQDGPDSATRIGGQLSNAFWLAFIPSAAAGAFAVSIYYLMLQFDLISSVFAAILISVLQAIVALIFVLKLNWLIISPSNSGRRLVPLSNHGAKIIHWLCVVLFIVKALSYVGLGARDVLSLPVASSVVQAIVEALITAVILIYASFLRPMIAVSGDPHLKGRAWPWLFRAILLITGIFLVISSLIGYVSLAWFTASQIVITGAILVFVYFGFVAAKAIMAQGQFANSPFGQYFAKRLRLSNSALDIFGLTFGLLLYIAVLLIAVPLILLQWGFHASEIFANARILLTDIHIGGIQISLVNLMIGVLLFCAGFFVTRRVQGWLDRNVLSRGTVETGVRNSVRKVFGYIGIAIFAMIGITAAGFDLSNLALVAGALSLGIGFGLQTIVSNFVSGLILLAERPFKAGDWVETGSVQGIVKEISVRATEIETFAKKSVIVPNSELVNGVVSNWTHRTTLGRVDVPVGVSYDNNPRRIMQLLLEIADGHRSILKHPEPSVEFADFGGSSLDFVLRGFLSDIGQGFSVRNDLRIAIYEKFEEEGVNIPFPQRDVNVRLEGGVTLSDLDKA